MEREGISSWTQLHVLAPAPEQPLEKQGGKKKTNCAKHLRNKEGFDSTSVPEENKELGSTHSRHGVSFRKIAEMSCESPSQQNISDADQKINEHCQA